MPWMLRRTRWPPRVFAAASTSSRVAATKPIFSMTRTIPGTLWVPSTNCTSAVSASSATWTRTTPGNFLSPFSTAEEHAEDVMPDTESLTTRSGFTSDTELSCDTSRTRSGE